MQPSGESIYLFWSGPEASADEVARRPDGVELAGLVRRYRRERLSEQSNDVHNPEKRLRSDCDDGGTTRFDVGEDDEDLG